MVIGTLYLQKWAVHRVGLGTSAQESRASSWRVTR